MGGLSRRVLPRAGMLAPDLRLHGMLCLGAWFADQAAAEALAAPR